MPAVLNLIRMTVEGAHRHKKWVGICGGIASDVMAVPVLIGLGVDELSVSVPAIPAINAMVSRLAMSECQVLAREVLQIDGNFLQMHCVLRNITERKRVEENRLQLTQRLQQVQKAESLARMAGAIAHHFSNQLQAVIGNLELAMEDLPRDVGRAQGLNDAMKAARKTSEVSSLMLTYLG